MRSDHLAPPDADDGGPDAADPQPAVRTGIGHAGRRINLVRLAEAQRGLIWCILARLAFELGSFVFSARGAPAAAAWSSLPPIILTIYLIAISGVLIATLVYVVKMAMAYGYHAILAVLGAIAVVVPCIGLLTLVARNQRVIASLRGANIRVGFMGVSKTEMLKLRLGVCHGCGYDLRGLRAARCPECGQPVTPVPVP